VEGVCLTKAHTNKKTIRSRLKDSTYLIVPRQARKDSSATIQLQRLHGRNALIKKTIGAPQRCGCDERPTGVNQHKGQKGRAEKNIEVDGD